MAGAASAEVSAAVASSVGVPGAAGRGSCMSMGGGRVGLKEASVGAASCGDHPWWRVPRSWLLLVGRLQRGCPDGRTGMPPMGGAEFRGRLRWAARVARPLGGAGTAGRGLLQAPVVAVGSSASRPRGNQAAGRGGIGVEVDPGCRAWQRAETDCLGPVLSIDTTRPSSRRAFGRPVWCPRPGEDSPHCRSIPGGASQTQA